MSATFDLFTVIARSKLNRGDDFSVHKIEKMEGGFLLEGSEFRLLTRGKNKGKPKWFGDSVKCICTKQELLDAQIEYEQTTGKCVDCSGSGKQLKSWSATEGKVYQPCSRCKGTGQKQ